MTETAKYEKGAGAAPIKYRVTENRELIPGTLLMRLEGDTSAFSRPGQFVNIAVDGCYLRRPISVADYDENGLTLVYDVVGKGTAAMAAVKAGGEFDVLPGLGNGFDPDVKTVSPLVLGGGIGTAPMLGLVKSLLSRNVTPTVVLGFNTASRVVMKEMFVDLGVETFISTVDGSVGTKGFVTDVIRDVDLRHDYFYACGPMPMLKALCRDVDGPGELSLDVRMACGFGACMCCSIETKNGPVCVCKQGPVFRKEVLIWK